MLLWYRGELQLLVHCSASFVIDSLKDCSVAWYPVIEGISGIFQIEFLVTL